MPDKSPHCHQKMRWATWRWLSSPVPVYSWLCLFLSPSWGNFRACSIHNSGITMATAVGISMISALTLCPALCAIMMRPSDGTKERQESINGRVRAYNARSMPYWVNIRKEDVLHPPSLDGMDFTGCCYCLAGLSDEHHQNGTCCLQGRPGHHGECQSISPGSHAGNHTKVMDKLEDILKDTPWNRTLRPRSVTDWYPVRELRTVRSLSAWRLERTKGQRNTVRCRGVPLNGQFSR